MEMKKMNKTCVKFRRIPPLHTAQSPATATANLQFTAAAPCSVVHPTFVKTSID